MNDEWIQFPVSQQWVVEGPAMEYSTHLSPSPYNVPRACRVRVDGSGELAIDFRYIDDGEPTYHVIHSPGVVATLGKHSKRVFQIRFDKNLVHKRDFRVDLVTDELKKMEQFGNLRFKDNYAAAERAVVSQWPGHSRLGATSAAH